MTRQPAAEKRFTVAWPMPRLAPVSSKARRGWFECECEVGRTYVSSRVKARLAPWRAGGLAAKFDPIVQPERAVVPELDGQRNQTVAGPMRRPRDRSDGEFCRVERDRLLEGVAALERRRLLAGPGADLRQARTGREIAVGLAVVDPLDRAAQADLAVQRLPVEEQGALGASIKLATLLAVDVGVEHEPALVEALHQHHADVGPAVGVDGGERHGGGVARLAPNRLLEPGGKQPQRLRGLGGNTRRLPGRGFYWGRFGHPAEYLRGGVGAKRSAPAGRL